MERPRLPIWLGWAVFSLLFAGTVVSSKPHAQLPGLTPAKLASSMIREEQKITVNGIPEVWRLEWKTPPKSSCGPEDDSWETCPCTGFAYGESGQLDLVRSTRGREVERLELTPLFGNDSPNQGAATLQRSEPQEKGLQEGGSDAYLARVRARPSVRIMRFGDYNHDGNPTEFFLQTGVEPCGKILGIVVGVTLARRHLHAFGTTLHPDKPLVMQKREWKALLKASGPITVVDWPCGDHRSDTETDLALSATNGRIQAVRRVFGCTETGKRGHLLRKRAL